MITDNQKELLLEQYYSRGILKKEVRSYEVSLWSLQDEFITVLKWSDVEQKGRIEHGKMTLNIDGTQKLSFSIPMYYNFNGQLIENPNWYNTKNGNLITGLRKIKVIFNKDEIDFDNIDWKAAFNDVYVPKGYNGNVDLYNRNIVPAQSFIDAGYTEFNDDLEEGDDGTNHYGTLYSASVDQTASDGKNYVVIYTPVAADGTVYSRSNVHSYLNGIISQSTTTETWLANDSVQRRLILGIFPLTSNDHTRSDNWGTELHEMQAEWDQIRAKIGMINSSNNPGNIVFDDPTFDYYKRYLCSINTFEFVIMSVEETHENGILTCNIEAEGLAFQELGKLGYKVNLSQANFELLRKEWEEQGTWTNYAGESFATEPIQNLNYWCEESGFKPRPNAVADMNSRQWYYEVRMHWGSFSDGSISKRVPNKLYEEVYTSAWDANLNPTATIAYKEKARAVEAEHSNLYNITQTIAEKFEVFCKYEYIYDENYHIIGRVVVFYNNFLNEDPNDLISLQYPYDSSKISRKMDSAEVTTKLYVMEVDDSNVAAGYYNIMDAPPNASKEDYILNFEYMYTTGAINKEQYDSIRPYEKKMRELNIEINNNSQQLSTYEVEISKIEAKLAICEKSIDTAEEQILQNNALKEELDSKYGDQEGNLVINSSNPDTSLISTREDGTRYLNLLYTNKGIVEGTVHIYKNWSTDRTTNPISYTMTGEITSFKYDYDDNNNIVGITLLNPTQLLDANQNEVDRVYLTYSYDPRLYYDNVVKIWQTKLSNELDNKSDYLYQLGPKTATDVDFDLEALFRKHPPSSQFTSTVDQQYALLNGKYKRASEAQLVIDVRREEKAQAVQAFEHMMGPALREGYWQPENYNDFGDHQSYTSEIQNTDITVDTGASAVIAWDSLLFDDEEKAYFKVGANETVTYYPMINLNTVFNSNIPTNLKDYSVVWKATTTNSNYGWDSIKDLTILAVGSQALFRFIKRNNEIIPVLVLIGAKTFSNTQLTRMMSAEGEARLEIYSTSISQDGTVTISHGETQPSISQSAWITVNVQNPSPDLIPIVQPRIKFSSLQLKTDSSNITIKYNNLPLEFAEHYYLNTRDTKRNTQYYPEYYITIKPETLVARGLGHSVTIDYILSNANTAIYLDALKVSKENAYPKVSYEITTNLLNSNLTNQLYNKLAQIVMVNDTDLKFENVFGYISGVELDLDFYENDTVEIKNYKTKFEDLFSTIVAQTESMKQNSGALAAMLGGSTGLSAEGLEDTINNNHNIMQAYIDSCFDSSQVVRDTLTDIFYEASLILSDANKSLNQVQALTLKNADILGKFAANIRSELTSKVTKSQTKPASFKTGDIWIKTDEQGHEIGRYVATYSSTDVTEDRFGTGGFVQTYDGTLSSITGAGMDIDTNNGLVDIYGAHEIKLRSGEHIYIAAGDTVDIVGNKNVNIGGGSVNIAANSNEVGSVVGGVHIVSAGIDFSNNDSAIDNAIQSAINSTNPVISKVLIDPNKIEMGSADILMRGANKIEMITSRGDSNNTSAISISPDNGVYIGSGKGVRIFSGKVDVSGDTITYKDTTTNDVIGASVELNDEHLILGFSDVGQNASTVIEMNHQYMIIAAGNAISGDSNDNNRNITGASTGLIGAKFTNESIGFATQHTNSQTNKTTYNTILMNDDGISIASAVGGIDLVNTSKEDIRAFFNATDKGSYVRVAADGIELSSLADLYINTDNFKLQTHSRDKGNQNSDFVDGETIMAIGSGLQSIDYNTSYDATNNVFKNGNTTISNNPEVRLLVNKNGLYVKGTVYADAGSFTGSVIANSFILNDNGAFKLSTNNINTSEFNTLIDNNTKVSTAASNALNAKNITDAFTTNGLLTDYSWGGQVWKVALTSTSNLLIGANGDTNTMTGGIWIAKSAAYSDGAAVVIDKSGIALNGATITLDAQANISMSSNSNKFIINSSTPKLYMADNATWTSANYGLSYDSSGLSVKGALTATSLSLTDGAIINLSSDNSAFVVPKYPNTFTGARDPNNPENFVDPLRLLIDKSGFTYQYFPAESAASDPPTSYIQINSSGMNAYGNNININSGHVAVNGQQLWEGSILYSIDYPNVHPEHNWVWIKPMSNAYSETILTISSGQWLSYGENTNATYVCNTAALQQIGAQQGDYRVDIWITATVVNQSNDTTPVTIKQGNIQLNVGIVGGTNNSITVCTIGSSNSIYATDISKEYRLGDTICAYGGYNYTNHNNPLGEGQSALTLTIKNNSNLYLRITEIRIRFSVEAANSMTPCNVYYFP